MSLEDSPPTPLDQFEMGDKLCLLPSGKINLVCDEFFIMNHGKYSMFYYVQRYPPNPLTKPPEQERIVLHFIPRSREDELVPR